MRTQNRYAYGRNQVPTDARRMIQERLEAKRLKTQQPEKYGFRGQRNASPEDVGAIPQSTKSQEGDKYSNKRYFQKQKIDTKIKTSNSQDTKIKNQQSVGKTKQTTMTSEKTNAEYLKLHEKLNYLESKISDMKKNLQRKKEEKLKKKKDQEQRRKRKISEQQKAKQLDISQEQIKENELQPASLKGFVTQVPERQELHTFQRDPYSPKHNIYYVSQIVRAYKDQKSLAREHVQTSLQIMAYFQKCSIPTEAEIAHKKVKLARRPGYEGKKTVVFDLDETLIHCNQTLDNPHDIKLPIVFPTGEVIEAGINIRPHATDILKNLSKKFEVIVFTASHSCYANVVIDYLDPKGQYVHHRLFRQNCVQTPEGMHVKDLRVIDRDLSQMVLVDNAAYSYIYQMDNGIPIIPYYHGNQDYQLQILQKYIESMLFYNDVRQMNRKTFKLHEYRNYYYDLEQLVEDLYLSEHK